MKIINIIILSTLLLVGCTKAETPAVVAPVVPQVTDLGGGVLSLKTSDSFGTIDSPAFTYPTGDIIPDGASFRIVSDTLLISNNKLDWTYETTAKSISGVIEFYVKPGQLPGSYQVKAYPVTGQTVKFDKNLVSQYYVTINAGNGATISNLYTAQFEDLPSISIPHTYNATKDPNEPWIVIADPTTISYISVGPIVDAYGNNVTTGSVTLSVSEGTIPSLNPVIVTDGYAYFTYKATSNITDLTVSAAYSDTGSIFLTKSSLMKLARPQVEILSADTNQVLTAADFTDMQSGQTKSFNLLVHNKGAIPATGLSFDISPAFQYALGSCTSHMTLRSDETCTFTLSYTRLPDAAIKNGNLKITTFPTFPTSVSLIPLTVSNVEPAALTASVSSINFAPVSCGMTATQEFYVINTGSYPANAVNVTQPPSSVSGQAPYFKVIIPDIDGTSSDPASIQNCGTTFLPGIKCRVIVQYNPLSVYTGSAVNASINASGISSILITLNGSAQPGQATGDIPMSILNYTDRTVTTSMYAQNGQRTLVRVGPISDSCNNAVADGTLVSAQVSGGTLNSANLTTNNGYVEFIWNAFSKAELLGNQTITVTSTGYSKEASILFQGINLSMTGPTAYGQVLIEKPKDGTYTVTNNGNIKATNVNFTVIDPMTVISLGTCANGLDAGQTCQATISPRPTTNMDYTTGIYATTVTPGINNAFITNITLSSRNKAVITTDATKYVFNDGSNGSSITRSILITNKGPAISYNTAVAVTAPYSILSSTCTDTMQVNGSCVVNVTVARSAAITGGVQKITISNEVDSPAVSATLSYAELQFSQETYDFKKYYCVGPITVKSYGANGAIAALSQSTVVNLSSTSGKVYFYSENTCNNKIVTTTIAANANTTPGIYFRSISAETNNILATSGNFAQATRSITFIDIKNDILSFKPAMALKNTSCILCHSSIKGNIVTDMNFSNGTGSFYGAAPTGTSGSGEYYNPTYTDWGGSSMSFGTSFIEGMVYIPHLTLSPTTTTAVQSMISAGQSTYGWYQAAASSAVTTASQYLNVILPYRTSSYLSYLNTYSNSSGSFAKDPTVNPANIKIREVKAVNISWPSASNITSFLDTGASYKYYAWEDTSLPLQNFGQRYGRFFGNLDPTAVMTCDGDLFVDGAVYLQSLRLQTNTGCRIYATGTVFIEAPNTAVAHRQGIEFYSVQTNSNIQITSAKGVMFGLGKCANPEKLNTTYPSQTDQATRLGAFGYRMINNDVASLGALISNESNDYDLIRSGSAISYANQLNIDAGNCASANDATYGAYRSVDFQRILINAPRFDSRYTGNFKGVMIGGHAIWSLGKFSYSYDSTFDSIPILPFFTPDVFFSVTDCVDSNGIDQATIVDPVTGYKTCQ